MDGEVPDYDSLPDACNSADKVNIDDLVPDIQPAILAALLVLLAGSSKHGRDGWRRYDAYAHIRAAHRHLNQESVLDDDTGLPHLHHALARLILAVLADHSSADF